MPRQAGQRGFAVLPWPWVMNRTFEWLGRQRRLNRDYKALPESSAAWAQVAISLLMLRRLPETSLHRHPIS